MSQNHADRALAMLEKSDAAIARLVDGLERTGQTAEFTKELRQVEGDLLIAQAELRRVLEGLLEQRKKPS